MSDFATAAVLVGALAAEEVVGKLAKKVRNRRAGGGDDQNLGVVAGGGRGRRDRAWRAKIHGNAQATGTPGHRMRTLREAMREAKKPDVVRVHMNHGYNRALGLPPKTIQANRRPDVTSVYTDRRVRRVEVESRTDSPAVLRRRNSELDKQLIEQRFTPLQPKVVKPNIG